MIGLGMVGCGWAAGEIVRAGTGLPRLEIVSVIDTDRGRAEALATKAGATVAADARTGTRSRWTIAESVRGPRTASAERCIRFW